MPQRLSAPGLIEIQAYRNITGEHQVTAIAVFEDLAGYSAWRSSDTIQKSNAEAWQYIENVHVELLGPSPVVPEPLRPQ